MAPASATRYTTKELSPATWPDFEALFAKHGGVQAGCWCMFYHRARPVANRELAGSTRVDRNRGDKKRLVERGRSHGILVYHGDRPVGWCQFGPREELPRIEAKRTYRAAALPDARETLWRITCFFVDRDARRQGVARAALRGALGAIRQQGGGVVEAYPATRTNAMAVWFGTSAMFEREGFRTIAHLGRSNVVMRKTL